MMKRHLVFGLGMLWLAGCDATTPVPDVSIGLNRPAPGLERRFGWGPRPGASAYVVVVWTDRSETQPAGSSGFTADTSLPITGLAWQEGHPLADRSYFWTVRAFDRPDPQGLMLAKSLPREFRPAAWEAGQWWITGPTWP